MHCYCWSQIHPGSTVHTEKVRAFRYLGQLQGRWQLEPMDIVWTLLQSVTLCNWMYIVHKLCTWDVIRFLLENFTWCQISTPELRWKRGWELEKMEATIRVVSDGKRHRREGPKGTIGDIAPRGQRRSPGDLQHVHMEERGWRQKRSYHFCKIRSPLQPPKVRDMGMSPL